MDENNQPGGPDEQAAAWLLRLQTGNMSGASRAQYVDWLRKSPVHVAEMLRVTQVHDALVDFDVWSEVDTGEASPHGNIIPLPVRGGLRKFVPRRRRLGKIRSLLMSAAALAALFVTVGLVMMRTNDLVISTAKAERREVALPDGSVLKVDPETVLRIRLASDVRRVELKSGRAVFQVAKDPHRPFIVRADGNAVRAVGTTFGVERMSQDFVVTVAEGKVAVLLSGSNKAADADQVAAFSHADSSLGGSILLTPDEQLTVRGSDVPAAVRVVDSSRALAWAKGNLVFDGEPIEHAIGEFNRYSHVHLQVTGSELANRRVTGIFTASDPEAFIAFMRAVMPIDVTREGDQITISARVAQATAPLERGLGP